MIVQSFPCDVTRTPLANKSLAFCINLRRVLCVPDLPVFRMERILRERKTSDPSSPRKAPISDELRKKC